jgi:hypothetical protein
VFAKIDGRVISLICTAQLRNLLIACITA